MSSNEYTLRSCLKCGDFIKKSPLKCVGICDRVCHVRCSGLTEQQLDNVRNIGWRCDRCIEKSQPEHMLKLQQWLRQHEKRLEALEAGLNSKLNNSCEAPALCPFLPHSISRKAIIITGILLGLTIIMGALLAVILGKTPLKSKLGDGEDTRQSIPINSPIDEVNIGGGLVLRYVPRAVWLAQPPQKELPSLSLPVPMVILLPTNSENCSTQAQCVFKVRFLQTFNIESERRDDISFNFLIGGDGNVYIGRGWDLVGAHLNGYNTRSVSFAYIGTFQHQAPSPKQLNVTRLLLEDGVNRGKIAPNYKLVGASTLEPTITQYNADRLYQSFSNWTHWTTVN
ncbi:peptidoglycan-recognition protein LC isoform X8 [Drosophila sulfurigaster albostrigata]|uniref:peptidoglycan-recognition protein LC isoform X8 n=1 Tax=Drosophila sulfurigaster albostrigata TaxID=89887 RepID=UPI002D21D501|nr:peptidoglycan-recognition protein LC isoform X8 [Drosophila sulfurigaster albostrigata]